jgi:NRPS condensation-like uncharacterized protein
VPDRFQYVPFSVVDQAIHLIDREHEPWSIQLEVRVPGRLDESRLREAVGQAIGLHPMARAHKSPFKFSDRRFRWAIGEAADLDPLKVVDCPDDEALDAVRRDLQSLTISLLESPPFRVRLAHHPQGDAVMLNASHAATDGFGIMRVLRSIARAYAGEPDPLPDLDPLEVRRSERLLKARDPETKARRVKIVAEKLRDLVEAPARVAPDDAVDRPGYAFHHIQLSQTKTKALSAVDTPGTVNDVLLAALTLAVAEWNAKHGRSTGRVSVLMPVNLRPREWWEEVLGNFTLMVRVVTSARQRRSPEAAVEAVARQTDERKGGGSAASLIEVLNRLPGLPIWAQKWVEPMLAITGRRLIDTAILTNLGKLDDPPSFGDDLEAEELWLSAPARMPLGVSLGAVTMAGRMNITFRYRPSLFGPDGGRRFAEQYLRALDHYVALAGGD